jgi:hypothetical protein
MTPIRTSRGLLVATILAALTATGVLRAEDPAFDRYLDVDLLERAWGDKNAPLLADIGLQLAEGERVLFRTHEGVTAEQVLAMATRTALERRDSKTLGRLAKACDALKRTDLAAQASTALRYASGTRDVDPALALSADRTSPEAFVLMRDSLESILDAKVMGDVDSLNIMIQMAPKMAVLPEAQRKHLVKLATAARDVLPKDGGLDPAAQAINKLLDDARTPREVRRDRGARKPKESTTLGIRYAGVHHGVRVTGMTKAGATPLAKGEKLEMNDLILRIGDAAAFGSQVDLDELVREAVATENLEVLVYRPRTTTVLTLQLPNQIPGIEP